jgi:hypothetical protein
MQCGRPIRVEAELAALPRPSVLPAACRHVAGLSRSLSKAGLDLRQGARERGAKKRFPLTGASSTVH